MSNFLKIGVVIVVFVLVLAFVVSLMPAIGAVNEEVRTDPQTQSLSCTTISGATSCAVTLANAHAYYDTSRLAITETSPGSSSRSGTLGSNRTTLTVSGLAASTAYTFSVSYQSVSSTVSSTLDTVMKLLPTVIIGSMFVALIGFITFLAMKVLRPAT